MGRSGNFVEGCTGVLLIISEIVAIEAAVALLFMYIWNRVISEVFGFPEITYWQALGLWILISMIVVVFRGFRNKDA